MRAPRTVRDTGRTVPAKRETGEPIRALTWISGISARNTDHGSTRAYLHRPDQKRMTQALPIRAHGSREEVAMTDITSIGHDGEGLTRDELPALPVTVDIATAAQALGLGRSTGYELARAAASRVRAWEHAASASPSGTEVSGVLR